MNIPEVMLASDFADRYGNPIRSYADYSGKFIIQEKLDGIRALIVHLGPGKTRVFGRNYRKDGSRSEFTEQCPEIVEFFKDIKTSFILDVELMSGDFLALQTKVRTTRKLINDPLFFFTAFDLLLMRGEDLTHLQISYETRIELVRQLQKEAYGVESSKDVPADGLFRIVRDFGMVRALDPEQQIDLVLKQVVEQGGEGLILKDIGSYYEPGKRSPHWVKVLPYLEMDVLFTGVVPGTGKFEGSLGALEVYIPTDDSELINNEAKTFKVGTGFTTEQRDTIWRSVRSGVLKFPIKGKIKYKELSKYGIPRMPVFLQFKED